MTEKIRTTKTKKRGIQKAIVFYQESDSRQYRMVTFGRIDELMDMFWDASKMWLDRVRKLVKESYGRELSKDEWTNMMTGTMPIWMTKHSHEALKEGSFNIDYWIEGLTKHGTNKSKFL